MKHEEESLGIYIHVPFCRTRCRYCDFYRVGENHERISRFLAALAQEIDGSVEYHDRTVGTIFFGGGTPSLLTPAQVASVLDHVGRRFRIAPDAEVTAEANPSDLDFERMRGLRQAGVNRLSIGVQSFNDRELTLLGRRHDAARARAVVERSRSAGFDNVSIDLMLATPGQTEAGFHHSVDEAIVLEPEHVSVYLLEVHPRSEIDGLRRARPRLFPSEEVQRRRYLAAVERLGEAGLAQYEVSNFSVPGRESRHNLRYWRLEPYLGFGPAAHSAVDGRRWRHPPDLGAYLEEPLAREPLPSDPIRERIFLGLRLRQGLRESDVASALGLNSKDWSSRVESLAPFLEHHEGRLRLSLEGILVSTSVLAELLG